MLDILLTSTLAACIGVLGTYLVAKRLFKYERMMMIFEDAVDDIMQNTEMQKKLFTFGVLLGQGIKSGVGITGKGGKFKLDDIIGQGIAMFFGNIMGGQPGQGQQPTTNPQLPPIPPHLRPKH